MLTFGRLRGLDVLQEHVDHDGEDVVQAEDEHQGAGDGPRGGAHAVHQRHELRQGAQQAHEAREPRL